MSRSDIEWLYNNMIGDNTGENISKLNRSSNEVCRLLGAWKNYDKLQNPRYIGLYHYRRIINFYNDIYNYDLYFVEKPVFPITVYNTLCC